MMISGIARMTSKPPRRVELTDYFLKDLKRLYRKYPNVRRDAQQFVRLLESGVIPGDQIQNIGYTVYKARIRNSDIQRGKSGGYRVIYYLRTADLVMLLTIYSKSEREDIDAADIRRIIELYTPQKPD
jgi:mRNA-degrading endonuclease RelE of RelBE toxin-antitoxin system